MGNVTAHLIAKPDFGTITFYEIMEGPIDLIFPRRTANTGQLSREGMVRISSTRHTWRDGRFQDSDPFWVTKEAYESLLAASLLPVPYDDVWRPMERSGPQRFEDYQQMRTQVRAWILEGCQGDFEGFRKGVER